MMKAPERTILFILTAGLVVGLCACQNPNTGGPIPPSPGGPPGVASQPPAQVEADIRMLRDALKVDPGNVDAWIHLGNNLMDTQRFADAVEAYGKALELQPENVNVRVDRGTCYRNNGNPEQAVVEYRKALEYDPNHINGNMNLGVVLFHDLNDPQGALAAWEKFLSLAPNHPAATAIRAEVSKIRAMQPKG